MENKQKEKLKELITANKELVFQNERKEKRAEELRRELVLAIEKFAFENEEKEKRAAELKIVNKELALQIKEKEKRAVEFAISQDKLMKSDRLFQLMISSINDYAIIMLDTKGNITTWNSGAQRIKGYTEDEIIGKSMDVFYTRQAINNKEPQKNLQAALQQGRFEKEDWRVRKDKSLFYANVIITSLFDYEGKHYGYAKVTRDITEQKKREEELKKIHKELALQNEEKEKRAAELTAVNKELEQFSYLTSHDLREPLLTIRAYIDLALKEFGEGFNEDAKRHFQLVSQASIRMEELINGLLDYSRLSTAKQLNAGVNCNDLLTETLADLDSLITKNQAKINMDHLPIIKAYPLELKLLFVNLITNAIKFRNKDIVPEINISSTKINKGWQFAIKDNGVGIEEKDREKIFMIFQRLHKRKEYEGTGIGLAYCKKITELHGGKIWVESIPGQSSTFYFTILTE